MPDNERKALLLGATGLIGSHLLQLLQYDKMYQQVVVLARKPNPEMGNNKVQWVQTDFSNLDNLKPYLNGITDVFCCVGTTIKKAKTQEAFKAIDFVLPLTLIQLARQAGCLRVGLVSSIGANAKSTNFYLKTKGELEAALKPLEFDTLGIVRPSLLLGKRTEFRLGERIAVGFMTVAGFLFLGPLRKYKAIQAEQVAKALLYLVKNAQGTLIVESEVLKEMAKLHDNQ